jgi:putative component of membrane protein insertase Oxa1/YidC/SpoIIIJ protein YidD
MTREVGMTVGSFIVKGGVLNCKPFLATGFAQNVIKKEAGQQKRPAFNNFLKVRIYFK